jgi:hypothetical protein
MTVTSLLAELHSLGVTLEAQGDQLRFRPVDAVPPDLLEHLRANKEEVIALLEHDPEPQAEADKDRATLEALSQIGAVLIRSRKFGSVWLALDQANANELREEESQYDEPCPVLTAEDLDHLETMSERAIRARAQGHRDVSRREDRPLTSPGATKQRAAVR